VHPHRAADEREDARVVWERGDGEDGAVADEALVEGLDARFPRRGCGGALLRVVPYER
jgi:hypothetical protein